jgi:deferrochelatase/peroxidase EfeB
MALTRRALLTSAGAGGLAAAARAGFAVGRDERSDGGPQATDQTVPFHGVHQAGIATAAQDRLHFAAFDVEDGLRAGDVRDPPGPRRGGWVGQTLLGAAGRRG